MSLKTFQASKMQEYAYNEFSSSKATDPALHSIKQSAYFHQEKKKVDPIELRFQAQDERIQQHEEQLERRFEHLEERVKQVNQKFERIEQLGERLESLNKLIDTLKTNFDAKLMVYDDKLNVAQQRFEKKLSQMRIEIVERVRSEQSSQEGYRVGGKQKDSQQDELANDMQQLFQLIKKTQSSQRDLQLEVSTLKNQMNNNQMTKERDIRQSEVIFTKDSRKKDQECVILGGLKQSNILSHKNNQQQQQNRDQIQSPSNHSRVESFKQQYHFGVTPSQLGTITTKNDRVRSITLEKEKQILQQDQENQRANKKEQISSQYLNTEEDEHEKKSRSRSKKIPLQVSDRNNELVDKYQFTLQSKVLQVIDLNDQRGNQAEGNQTASTQNAMCNKSKSQQGQLRMTFNFKDELQAPRDRIQSKGTTSLINHSNKESKTNIQNIQNIQNQNSQNKIIDNESGKIKTTQQLDKQNLLERATSQDNFRSKYLSSDKVGKLYRADEEQDYLKNMRK